MNRTVHGKEANNWYVQRLLWSVCVPEVSVGYTAAHYCSKSDTRCKQCMGAHKSNSYTGSLQCIHRITAMHTQDHCNAHTGPLQCTHRTTALHTQDHCTAHTGPLQCTHRITAMHTQDHCTEHTGPLHCTHRTTAMHTQDHCNGHTGSLQCTNRITAMHTQHHCQAHTGSLQCIERITAMHTQDRCNAYRGSLQVYAAFGQLSFGSSKYFSTLIISFAMNTYNYYESMWPPFQFAFSDSVNEEHFGGTQLNVMALLTNIIT